MKPLPHDFEPDESGLLNELGDEPFGPRRSNHCPPAAMIQALLAGALPEDDSAALQRHIESCPACAALHSAFAALEHPTAETDEVDHLWTRIEPHLKRERRPMWHWAWIPAAAAAAIAIAVLAPALFAPQPLTLAYHPPAPASPAVPQYQAQAFDMPPVRLPAGGLLLWRGSDADPLPESTRELAHALEPYRTGDLNETERRLANLDARYPDIFEVPFYRGVCLLYLNRPGARDHLARARHLGSENQSAEASWYLALALLQDGSIAQARPLLNGLCTRLSARSDAACQVIGQLSEVRFSAPGR
jgi:hypothetical protein